MTGKPGTQIGREMLLSDPCLKELTRRYWGAAGQGTRAGLFQIPPTRASPDVASIKPELSQSRELNLAL